MYFYRPKYDDLLLDINAKCKNLNYHGVYFSERWNPKIHNIFPTEFKNLVLLLLMINKMVNKMVKLLKPISAR